MAAVALQYTGVPCGSSPCRFGEPGCRPGIQVWIALEFFPEFLLESRWAVNPGGQSPALKALHMNTTPTEFKSEGFTWAREGYQGSI